MLQYSSAFLVLCSSKLNTDLQMQSPKFPKAVNPSLRPAARSPAHRIPMQLTSFATRARCRSTLSCCLPDSRPFPAKFLSRQTASRLGCCRAPVCPGAGRDPPFTTQSHRGPAIPFPQDWQVHLPSSLLLPVRCCPQTGSAVCSVQSSPSDYKA